MTSSFLFVCFYTTNSIFTKPNTVHVCWLAVHCMTLTSRSTTKVRVNGRAEGMPPWGSLVVVVVWMCECVNSFQNKKCFLLFYYITQTRNDNMRLNCKGPVERQSGRRSPKCRRRHFGERRHFSKPLPRQNVAVRRLFGERWHFGEERQFGDLYSRPLKFRPYYFVFGLKDELCHC